MRSRLIAINVANEITKNMGIILDQAKQNPNRSPIFINYIIKACKLKTH